MAIEFGFSGSKVSVQHGSTGDVIDASLDDWERLLDTIDLYLEDLTSPPKDWVWKEYQTENQALYQSTDDKIFLTGTYKRNLSITDRVIKNNVWIPSPALAPFSGFEPLIYTNNLEKAKVELRGTAPWHHNDPSVFDCDRFAVNIRKAIATAKESLIKEFVESIPGTIAILLPNKIPQHVLKLMLEVTGSDGDDLDYIVISNQSEREAVYEICDRIAYSYCISRYSWNDLLIVFVEH